MKHINFINVKPAMKIKTGKLELDYLIMILIIVGVLAVSIAFHMIERRRFAGYQQELELHHQSSATPQEAVVMATVEGFAWSDWLKKYAAEFPESIRVNQISATTIEGNRIILEAVGQTTLDASRAKRSLLKTGLCQQAEVKTINQSEETVLFELECKL